jgi:hypothetical protein
MNIRQSIYQPANSHFEEIYKNTGMKIFSDYKKTGAKVGVISTAPAYYAQGIPFYFIISPQFTHDDLLNYFKTNNVDYIVATSIEIAGNKKLEPLFDPSSR